MPSEAAAKMEFRVCEFTASMGAVKVGKDQYRLVAGEPLYIANKANLRIVATGGKGRRFGGEQWEGMKAFQAAIALAGRNALRAASAAGAHPWPTDRVGYAVAITLEIGDRIVEVEPEGRKAYQRRMRARVRWRHLGVDKAVEAILDGLQGILWDDDERVTRIFDLSKVIGPHGIAGDVVRVAAVIPSEPMAHHVWATAPWALARVPLGGES